MHLMTKCTVTVVVGYDLFRTYPQSRIDQIRALSCFFDRQPGLDKNSDPFWKTDTHRRHKTLLPIAQAAMSFRTIDEVRSHLLVKSVAFF